MDELAQVVRRLLDTPAEARPADLPWIQSLHLSGFVWRQLPAGHELQEALRPAALRLKVRHAMIRRELQPLLRVWAEAGIPVMLLKGFSLAEFDYAAPEARFYGDVDLLLPADPAVVARAVHLALAYGWRSDGLHARPADWTHECAHLYSPGGQVKLDVHRFVPAWNGGPQGRVRHITAQLWAAAVTRDWDGVPLRLPQPLDRAVITLALGRCWGGDTGGLKPADTLDLRVLRERYGLTEEALSARSEELGASHTWAAFSAVCRPDHPEFAAALRGRLPRLLAAVRRDGAGLLPSSIARLRRAPVLAFWMLRLLPDVYVTGRAWRRGDPPQKLLPRWTAPAQGRLNTQQQLDIASAARWWVRLLYPQQARRGDCVPRAYATFHALRRYGHPAVFVSGVARSPQGVTGHAWVEDDRGVMEMYGEPLVRLRFTESFRYPPASEKESDGLGAAMERRLPGR